MNYLKPASGVRNLASMFHNDLHSPILQVKFNLMDHFEVAKKRETSKDRQRSYYFRISNHMVKKIKKSENLFIIEYPVYKIATSINQTFSKYFLLQLNKLINQMAKNGNQ